MCNISKSTVADCAINTLHIVREEKVRPTHRHKYTIIRVVVCSDNWLWQSGEQSICVRCDLAGHIPSSQVSPVPLSCNLTLLSFLFVILLSNSLSFPFSLFSLSLRHKCPCTLTLKCQQTLTLFVFHTHSFSLFICLFLLTHNQTYTLTALVKAGVQPEFSSAWKNTASLFIWMRPVWRRSVSDTLSDQRRSVGRLAVFLHCKVWC